jgi:hypothetical protein
MIHHLACLWSKKSRAPRAGSCRRPPRRLSVLERLEARTLLSGNPTVYTVDLTSDTGGGSGTAGDLLYAVEQANANPNPAGSMIEFDTNVFNLSSTHTIALSSTLNLTGTAGPIVIDGGEPVLILGSPIFPVAISGNDSVRVFDVAAGVTATISGLEITTGLASRGGGGVLNEGDLTLSGCEISDSTAATSGGGIENDLTMTVNDCVIENDAATDSGGGVYNLGVLDMENSAIVTNSVADGEGGGVFSSGALDIQSCAIEGNTVNEGYGGGAAVYGVATISMSNIDDNSTNFGTSGGEGGGIYSNSDLTVADSALVNNTSSQFGGGILNVADLTISYSTIAENQAGQWGGGILNNGTLEAVNMTIADNGVGGAGGGGGGLFSSSTATGTELINTIIALNTDNIGPDDLAGVVSVGSSNNLIGTGGSGGLPSGEGNQVGVANPGLGSLANNGGPTLTFALLPDSPAINAGTDFSLGASTDQRGPGFVRTNDGTVDIGAYEHQPSPTTGGGGSTGTGGSNPAPQPAAVSSVAFGWGTQTDALETAVDGLRLLPAGRNTDLPWLGIDALSVTLNEPETLSAGEVSIVGITGINYGPVTISGSGTNYTITFAHAIEKADRVTITIAGAGITTYTRRLDVLPGDFYDTGVVNNKDLTAIHNESKHKNGAQPTIFGDILGNGTVNGADYNAARKFKGKRLPNLPAGGSAARMALSRSSSFAPRKDDVELSRSNRAVS